MKKILENPPLAYHIIFRVNSTWCHGDNKLSIDPKHNQVGEPKIQSNPGLLKKMQENSNAISFTLNHTQREIVLKSIIKTCKRYKWHLFAAHVLTNHVHIVLQSNTNPEHPMTQIKACATLALRKNKAVDLKREMWARHGSTKYIKLPENLNWVMDYVIARQGVTMSCFHDKSYNPDAIKKILLDLACSN